MKKLVLALIALGLTGCTEFGGQLSVLKSFEALSKSGVFGSVRKITVNPGQYEAKMSGTVSRDLVVAVKLNGKNEKIRLEIPRNRIPEQNGSFELQAAELKQPFSARGELQTQRTESSGRRTVESCTRTRTRTICRRDDQGNRVCRDETETISGEQEVEFFNRTTTVDVRVELVNPSFPSEAAAIFKGTSTDVQRIYTFRGICY